MSLFFLEITCTQLCIYTLVTFHLYFPLNYSIIKQYIYSFVSQFHNLIPDYYTPKHMVWGLYWNHFVRPVTSRHTTSCPVPICYFIIIFLTNTCNILKLTMVQVITPSFITLTCILKKLLPFLDLEIVRKCPEILISFISL